MSKSFKLNAAVKSPTMNFISDESKKEIETKINDTDKVQVVDENGKLAVVHLPKGYKIEDIKLENMFKEKKNKRLQVLMYPTQYNRMKNYCESNNIKINSFINEAIIYYLDKLIEETKKQQ